MSTCRKDLVFLLEMPHSICHLILKRGHMLRSVRTRSLRPLGKGGPKIWLQAKLIPASDESTDVTWDKAHELVDKFKRELHTDVYVEPGLMAGRYQSILAQEKMANADPNQINHAAPMAVPIASPGFPYRSGVVIAPNLKIGLGLGPNRSQMGFPVVGVPGNSMPQLPGTAGHQIAHLPPQVEAFMAGHPATLSHDVTCPALRQLQGWSSLPETKQQMLEAEAAQLIKNGLIIDASEGLPKVKRSTLEVVRLQPNVSKMLKHFLDNALLVCGPG